jgi:hypothetical protein
MAEKQTKVAREGKIGPNDESTYDKAHTLPQVFLANHT